VRCAAIVTLRPARQQWRDAGQRAQSDKLRSWACCQAMYAAMRWHDAHASDCRRKSSTSLVSSGRKACTAQQPSRYAASSSPSSASLCRLRAAPKMLTSSAGDCTPHPRSFAQDSDQKADCADSIGVARARYTRFWRHGAGADDVHFFC